MTLESLERRVRYWQQQLGVLGISHFEIEEINIVEEDDEVPDALVSIDISHTYDKCKFHFTRDFLEGITPTALDKAIIHEWLHVAMRDFDRAADPVSGWMPTGAYIDWAARMDHEREGFVQRAAEALFFCYTFGIAGDSASPEVGLDPAPLQVERQH